MKFKDIITGATLDVANEFVIEQYKKHTERYKEVKPEPKKTEEKK
jgi:hypothetical protein